MAKLSYKIVVFVPQTHTEQVRIAATDAGAGKLGKYDSCAFLSSGIGTYRPLKGSKPFKGEPEKLERVGEARIEMTVSEGDLKNVIAEIRKIHPYEEPVIDIYRIEPA